MYASQAPAAAPSVASARPSFASKEPTSVPDQGATTTLASTAASTSGASPAVATGDPQAHAPLTPNSSAKLEQDLADLHIQANHTLFQLPAVVARRDDDQASSASCYTRRSSSAATDWRSNGSGAAMFDQFSLRSLTRLGAGDRAATGRDGDDDLITPPSTAPPSLFSGEGEFAARKAARPAARAVATGVTAGVASVLEADEHEDYGTDTPEEPLSAAEQDDGSEDEIGIDLPAAVAHAQTILQAEAKALLDAAARLARQAQPAAPNTHAQQHEAQRRASLAPGPSSAKGKQRASADDAAAAQQAASAPAGFARAIKLLVSTVAGGGKIVWTGVGKSGHIARKLHATTLSLGLPSAYLHPTEALHGDLGALSGRFPYSPRAPLLRARASEHRAPPAPVPDVVCALSHSGGSPEVAALLPHILNRGCPIVAFSARQNSKLVSTAEAHGGAWVECMTSNPPAAISRPLSPGSATQSAAGGGNADAATGEESSAHCACCSRGNRPGGGGSGAPPPPSSAGEPPHDATSEADPLVPAPTSSTTVALAMGDALVLSVARACGLGRQSFAACHPGGSLGAQLGGEEGIRVAIGAR